MADLLPSIPDASAPEDAEPRVVGLEDEDADVVLGALSSTTARELFAALNDDPAHPARLADRVDTSLQNVQYHLGKLEDAGMVEVVDTAYSEKGREMDVYAPADRPLVLFAGDEEEETLLHRALGRLLGGVGVLAGATLSLRGLVGAEESGTQSPAGELLDSQTRSAGGADGEDDAAAGADGGDGSADGGADTTGGADGGGGMDDTGDAGGTDGGADAGGGSDAGESADAGDPTGGQYSDANATDLEFTGAQQDGGSVEPVASEIAWIAEPLEATGLPPALAFFVLGACLLAVGTAAWYWRMRQTHV